MCPLWAPPALVPSQTEPSAGGAPGTPGSRAARLPRGGDDPSLGLSFPREESSVGVLKPRVAFSRSTGDLRPLLAARCAAARSHAYLGHAFESGSGHAGTPPPKGLRTPKASAPPVGDGRNQTGSARDSGESRPKGWGRGCPLSDQSGVCLEEEALGLKEGVGTFCHGQVEPREDRGP